MKPKSIFNLGLALVLLSGLLAWAGPAQPARAVGTWYVAPGGNDSANCATPTTPCKTIQAAVDKAVEGDTILAAQGGFTGDADDFAMAYIQKSVTLSGGWDSDFSVQDGLSTIDGENERIGLYYKNSYALSESVDRFIIQNGYSGEAGEAYGMVRP
jgi:hypothetical protein